MNIGDKLKERRKELGLSMKEVAKKTGVSEATVSRWENGQIANMKRNFVPAYAKALGVTTEFIMGFEDPDKVYHKKFVNTSYTQIPVYSYVSAGSGCFADGNIECSVDIPASLARSGEYFGLRVKGDSMSPNILDQDIVIVRKQDYADDGQTVVAIVNGFEGFVKKLNLYGNSIALISNNPDYKPMIYTKEEVENLPVRIMGVVVELRRSF